MNRPLPFLILLASVCGLHAASPALTDFRGTNEVLVITNPTTHKVVIGPATPISTIASNAANALNLWTNPMTGFVTLSQNTNVVLIYDTPPSLPSGNPRLRVSQQTGFVGIDVVNVSTNEGVTQPIYDTPGTYGVRGAANGITTSGANIGVSGRAVGKSPWNYGVAGIGFADNSSTAGTEIVGVHAGVVRYGISAIYNAIAAEILEDDSSDLVLTNEFTVALFDSRTTGAPLLTCRTNNGGYKVFQVLGTKTTNAVPFDSSGIISGYSGLASYSTTATNQIPTTGWTNNATINVTVYTTATAVSFTINNRAGTVLYTSPTLTATMPVNLQPGWSVRAASGLTGTVVPN